MSTHIAILDIGKTNKKIIVFDQDYRVVFEYSEVLEEIVDEDGFPCEDVSTLRLWCLQHIQSVLQHSEYHIKAINFSAYGASFVFIDAEGQVQTPLYNYLKPLDQTLKNQFDKTYNSKQQISLTTHSPALGMLNSGLQLYRIRQHMPLVFKKIVYALHLPQYLSYLFSGIPCTEITSLGCHTFLWDFQKKDYHTWVRQEKLDFLFPPLVPAPSTHPGIRGETNIAVGTGMHDSSAALIPYLIGGQRPFILLSTGTWCIALNPFNDTPLKDYELRQDCLSYISYEGKPVKASRLFLGQEYQELLEKLAKHFNCERSYFQSLGYDVAYLEYKALELDLSYLGPNGLMRSGFEKRDWFDFDLAALAYHILMYDLVRIQKKAIHLIQTDTIGDIYVDGGFAKNKVFMHLMANAFPDMNVYAADVPQASALGAALVIHPHWNPGRLPLHLLNPTLYSAFPRP